MAKTKASKKSIQVRLDAALKRKVEGVLERMGIDVPTAVRMYFVKIAATGAIPFVVKDMEEKYDDRYTPEQLAEISRLAAAAKRGEDLSPPYSTAEDLVKALNA